MWPQGSGTSGTTCAGEINESPHQEKGVCPQGKLGKKSSEACVSSDTYMSVARAAAAAITGLLGEEAICVWTTFPVDCLGS